MKCVVCGGTEFDRRSVLWQQLVDEWQLGVEEREYIDRQQGEHCSGCGSNLRSIALARAILATWNVTETLSDAIGRAPEHQVLEINEAGNLTPHLRSLPNYIFAAYPEVDMHALPFADGSFDLVVHSDTLEHIPNPVHALGECWRVLRPGGTLCYTVPIVIGRMTRSRAGLARSYHGDPATSTDDFVVQTEFGADAWSWPLRAGFRDVGIHTIAYPCAVALSARR